MLTFCQLQNKLNGVQHVTRAQTPCLQKTTKFGVDCAITLVKLARYQQPVMSKLQEKRWWTKYGKHPKRLNILDALTNRRNSSGVDEKRVDWTWGSTANHVCFDFLPWPHFTVTDSSSHTESYSRSFSGRITHDALPPLVYDPFLQGFLPTAGSLL